MPSIPEFFVRMYKNIDKAGEISNGYGLLAATGYFVPVWSFMFVIAWGVAHGFPSDWYGWIGFTFNAFVFPLGIGWFIVTQSMKRGGEATAEENIKIAPCRICKGRGYLPRKE